VPQRRYIALLRGINVGGHAIVKMADLRAQFELLGFTDVASYIQTGNVLFTATVTDTLRLKREIEGRLEASIGYRGAVFVLSLAQLQQAAAHNPFDPERLDEEQRCHLMFLSEEPDAAHREALMAMQSEVYRFAVHNKVMYYAYPRKFDGRRKTIDFEKVLGTVGTARSWKVVDKLIELAQ
jgi:uncharacterized protein (DUF1697 family)